MTSKDVVVILIDDGVVKHGLNMLASQNNFIPFFPGVHVVHNLSQMFGKNMVWFLRDLVILYRICFVLSEVRDMIQKNQATMLAAKTIPDHIIRPVGGKEWTEDELYDLLKLPSWRQPDTLDLRKSIYNGCYQIQMDDTNEDRSPEVLFI